MRDMEPKVIHGPSLFTDLDIYLFKAGRHFNLYDKLGSHQMNVNGVDGIYFAVWAPNAEKVSVIGDFNYWNREEHFLGNRWDSSGIWEGFIPNLKIPLLYKYFIVSKHNGYRMEKGDPFAFMYECPPKSASIVWNIGYKWHDEEWKKKRANINRLDKQFSVYETHFGSWQRNLDGTFLSSGEIADRLVKYCKEMHFTHVEFLPIMEHPFYGSWGYQCLGYFAPSNRYGTSQDIMSVIDELHQEGIGVILDWVPSHFPGDEHGLAHYDGTCLYEHEDPKKGYHPDWGSVIFNYGRLEVRSFLVSSAFFWLSKYHADGLRIDAVASMLYLDYSRKEGEWVPNIYGGNENLEAIEFLRTLNSAVYEKFPDVQMIAEESSSWPMVTRPVSVGGLGFGMKWNMGWMHDTLNYFSKDPIYRKYHHNELTFSMMYAFSENFILSLSHDEVVYGKRSLLERMPGDDWQKFANLRLLFGYMFAHPGKKLLFMGAEFGQRDEWHHEKSLDWHLIEGDFHRGVQKWTKDLNFFYSNERALYEVDFEWLGFEWIDCKDYEKSILSFMRKSREGDTIVVACNFTPVCYESYRIGMTSLGCFREILNSDAIEYGGSGVKNEPLFPEEKPFHGKPYSVSLRIPPLGIIFLKRD